MIIGPSHVVRWERLKKFFDINDVFYGHGSLPIWHDKVKQFSQSAHPFIMVGDFRFGNAYLVTNNPKDMCSIKKEFFNVQTDKRAFDVSVDSLDRLNRHDIRLVFWCLFIREYKNRSSGKYTVNGDYKHPVWNLGFVEERFKNSIKLSSLFGQDLDFLIIDGSNHPSTYGYYFLKMLYRGKSPVEAFNCALELRKTFSKIFKIFGGDRFVVSGTNNSFKLFRNYMNWGVFESRQLSGMELRPAEEAIFSSHKYCDNLLYFAGEENAKIDSDQLSHFDNSPYRRKLLVVKKSNKTYFYESFSKCKPTLKYVLAHDAEDEEVAGDMYNLVGMSQVIYVALSLMFKEGLMADNPYCVMKKLVSRF
ncbi:hypothetical protein QEM42_003446 [Pseudomonas putida]|uniref:hypothetical protein n=1 Tax=Pseudomonas TaxID=286 RepID=UPI0016472566|nr:hypothetical protein [Pseudomonas putida]EKT4562249.1 hypothetical protein [Pseudomonas putida]MDP9540272.1 hypothetical protein [Pseudomonas putida]